MDFGMMWIDLGWASLFGALGGFGAGLLQDKGLEWPRQYRENNITYIKFGFFADILLGILAAIIVFTLNPPTGPAQLVASTIAAGIGGSAILKGYVNGKMADEQAKIAERYKQMAKKAMGGFNIQNEMDLVEKDEAQMKQRWGS